MLIGCEKEEVEPVPEIQLQIGDNYAGGIIFYLDKSGKSGKVCSTGDLGSLTWPKAMVECEIFDGGGYADWYLPSKDELNELFVELHLNEIGDFVNVFYWSSTESSEIDAWYQYFLNGNQNASSKAVFRLYVRAVRTFDSA